MTLHSSSILVRPLRQLFDQGKPPGKVLIVWCEFSSELRLPLIAICATQNCLVAWPAIPARIGTAILEGDSVTIDHLTLVRSTGTTHVTGFGPDGSRQRRALGDRLGPSASSGAQLWLIYAVRRTILEQQCGEFEWTPAIPASDENRRSKELMRYANETFQRPLFLPVPEPRGDFVLTTIHLLPAQTLNWFGYDCFPKGSPWDEEIEGWPDGDRFDIAPVAIDVGSACVGLATACPPGNLRNDVFLGCPN